MSSSTDPGNAGDRRTFMSNDDHLRAVEADETGREPTLATLAEGRRGLEMLVEHIAGVTSANGRGIETLDKRLGRAEQSLIGMRTDVEVIRHDSGVLREGVNQLQQKVSEHGTRAGGTWLSTMSIESGMEKQGALLDRHGALLEEQGTMLRTLLVKLGADAPEPNGDRS